MMKKKFLIIASLIWSLGAAALFAEAACCASPVRGNPEAAPAVDPVRLMLNAYEDMADALAADDLEKAQAAARRFDGAADITGATLPCAKLKEDCCENGEECAKSLQAILETEDIEEARTHFKVISAQAIQMAAGREGYYVMFCPMAGKNADWVQSDPEIRNPYHGSRMLHCGVIKSGGE